MENAMNWEQNTLINELTQGFELAKQLKVHLTAPETSIETKEFLLHKVLSSYDKALMILNWSRSRPASVSASTLVPRSQPQQPQTLQLTTPTHSVPASPAASIDGSPRSDGFDRVNNNNNQQYSQNVVSKKRKMPKWTEQVRVCSENGLEGPHCDGHSWRKYGQKDILGAKHPRSYYRCTYRNIKDCWATKQVQRSDDDPTIFEITYRGAHTCVHGNQSDPQPATPETQENKQDNDENQSNKMLQNFKNGLRVDTTTEPFIFPATSEPLSFFPSLDQMSHDVNDIVSVDAYLPTSVQSLDFDFSLDRNEFDPNFPFATWSYST